MNNHEFVLAADGWTQITPCGDFPHVGAGVTQVIDREACDRIAADFNGRKSDSNFPGVLVDFRSLLAGYGEVERSRRLDFRS